MNFKAALLSAAFGAVVLAAGTTPTLAGPVNEAGETIGLALGAPLPQGFYLINTGSYISRASTPTLNAVVNIPVLAWSSPWKVLGGRFEAYGALPEDGVGVDHTTWLSGIYNPAALFGIAWDLGNGWSFSNFVGGYAPVKADGLAQNVWTFNERAALSYTANGWDVTAHALLGISSNDVRTHQAVQPDTITVDLTATKSFGKWEVGPVSYVTSDLSKPYPAYQETSQFALGGLVGYAFGPLSVQFYVTQDVANSHVDHDTRGFVRFVVPL